MNTAQSLEPLFNDLVTIIAAVALPLIVALVNKYVSNAAARAAIINAVTNASGIAAAYGQTKGDQYLQNANVKSVALQMGIAYVADQVPQALKYFGQTDADIAAKIESALALHFGLATPIPPVVPIAAPAASTNAAQPALVVPATPLPPPSATAA